MKPALSKKARASVGVQRQYSGTAGRIENCQLGVFLSYASPKGHTKLGSGVVSAQELDREPDPLGGKLTCPPTSSLPASRSWPHACVFRTLDAGVPAAWVVGDTVYGRHRPLRAGLEARLQAYALAVSRP